jgi:hypothetical protein
MTASYSLAPEPVWVLINLVGTVAGGGYLVTKRSLNKIEDKPTFVDPAGEEAWPNPTFFDLNGTHAPIYWEFDPAFPDETYFVQAYDANGALLWEVDGFTGQGGGGGGTITEIFPLDNLIANNVFINHSATISSPSNITNYVICPSNHKGFTPALINPITTAYGTIGPDIRFNKNNTGLSSDSITFPVFALSDSPMALEGDVTPAYSIEYVCTGTPAGETFKNFQFPICQKVKNLSNQIVTFRIWAKVAATPETITIYTLQYYGSGTGATAPVQTQQGTIALTTTWTAYVLSFTVPDVSAGTLGVGGKQTDDDALYIQLGMPLGTSIDVLFTKPALYLGNIDPTTDFQTYDQIDSVDQTPRTGDIRVSLTSSPPPGWLAMNDTSIGNTGSGATTAGDYTYQLYKTLWDGISNPSGNVYAPVSTGLGASATADFLAGKTLTLPLSLGRAIAGAGSGAGLTARVLGEDVGEETHVLTVPEMPAHTHPPLSGSAFVQTNGSAVEASDPGSSLSFGATTGSTGGSGAHNNMQPTSFFNVFIKL